MIWAVFAANMHVLASALLFYTELLCCAYILMHGPYMLSAVTHVFCIISCVELHRSLRQCSNPIPILIFFLLCQSCECCPSCVIPTVGRPPAMVSDWLCCRAQGFDFNLVIQLPHCEGAKGNKAHVPKLSCSFKSTKQSKLIYSSPTTTCLIIKLWFCHLETRLFIIAIFFYIAILVIN